MPDLLAHREAGTSKQQGPSQRSTDAVPTEEVEGRSGVKESVLQLPRCQAEGNRSGVILWPKSPPGKAGRVSQKQCQTEPRPQSSAEGKEGITQHSKENQVRKITPFFM